jgi:hypothetical protein
LRSSSLTLIPMLGRREVDCQRTFGQLLSKPYDPNNPLSRPGKWVPKDPKAARLPGSGGSVPQGSWDPVPSSTCPNGHGDYVDGLGGPVQHFDANGNPITPQQAHGQNPPSPPPPPKVPKLPWWNPKRWFSGLPDAPIGPILVKPFFPPDRNDDRIIA